MKQKILATMLCIFLIIILTSCSEKSYVAEEVPSVPDAIESVEDIQIEEIEKDDGLVTVKTKHFSLKIPKEWEQICSYETDDMSISFTHKKSAEQGCGGYLFSISVEDLSSYYDYGGESIIGGVSIPGMGEFNVWKFGPSDVQSSDETHDEYTKCSEEFENIISTISFNEGYYFTKTPYEIQDDEPINATYNDSVPEQNNTYDYEPEEQLVIPDWKIESIAESYFENVLARQLKDNARKEGGSMAMTVSGTQITSRSTHTVNVRSRLNYTRKINGISSTGSLYAVAVIDIYTGEILSADIQ